MERGGSHRRRDVQGLRAVAVLLVVAYHAGLNVPGGFAGVDVFFVISGFVITGLLTRELESTGRVDLRRFYARRARRLLPALAVVTSVTAAVAFVVQAPFGAQQSAGRASVTTSLFVVNLDAWRAGNGYFDTASELNPLLHMWSLAVEEQFYAVYPVLLLLVWTLAARAGRLPWRWATAGLIVAGALSFAGSLVAAGRGGDAASLAFYALPTRAWEFAVGGVLALVLQRGGRKLPRRLAHASGVASIAMLAATALTISESTPFPGTAALLPVGGAALAIIAGTSGRATPLTRLLETRLAVNIGDLSYAWYLWHWPAVVFGRNLFPDVHLAPVFAAGLSLVPAWLSTRFLEAPVRAAIRMPGRRVLALAMACVIVPVGLGSALLAGSQQRWNDEELQALGDSRDLRTLGRRSGCLAGGDRPAPPSLLDRCAWRIEGSRGRIMLVGDSHADSLSDGVRAAAHELGYDFSSATGASCSFTRLSVFQASRVTNCGELHDWAVRAATADPKPRLVVVSHFGQAYVEGRTSGGGDDPETVWRSALLASVSAVRDAGVPVLMVADIPLLGLAPEPCRFGVVLALSCDVDAGASLRLQSRGHAVDVAVAREAGVPLLDLRQQFCTERTCSARRGRVLLYADNQHLDAAGSLAVSGPLRDAMQAALGTPTTSISPRGRSVALATPGMHPHVGGVLRAFDDPVRHRLRVRTGHGHGARQTVPILPP